MHHSRSHLYLRLLAAAVTMLPVVCLAAGTSSLGNSSAQPAAIAAQATNASRWRGTIPDGFGSGRPGVEGIGGEAREPDLFRDAGLRIGRSDFQWELIEKEKGRYDFREYDLRTDVMTKRGIRPLYILDYSHRFYERGPSVVTEAGRQAFVRWATASAQRYARRNVIWEIWNEPNIFFWEPKTPTSIADYCKLVAAVAPAIRTVDPTATIVGPATSEIPLDWLEQAFKLGVLEHLDGVSVHPYRRAAPETVVPEYERLRDLIRRYTPPGKEIPILSTEWGYTSGAQGLNHMPVLSQEGQASYLVRMLLVHQWQGVPVTVWFDWKNWSDDWNNSDANAGIVTHDLKPKIAYQALQVLSRTLAGFGFDQKFNTPDKDVYVLGFHKEDAQALALWSAGQTREVTVPVPAPAETVSVAEVYWFDDAAVNGGCRVPRSWRLLYQAGNQWKPVAKRSGYTVEKDQFNRVSFDPVETFALRLEVELQPGFSGGIWEWRVGGPSSASGESGIARASKLSASHLGTSDTRLSALNDGRVPKSTGDLSVPRFTWWDHKGTTEWVEYRFQRSATLVSMYGEKATLRWSGGDLKLLATPTPRYVLY